MGLFSEFGKKEIKLTKPPEVNSRFTQFGDEQILNEILEEEKVNPNFKRMHDKILRKCLDKKLELSKTVIIPSVMESPREFEDSVQKVIDKLNKVPELFIETNNKINLLIKNNEQNITQLKLKIDEFLESISESRQDDNNNNKSDELLKQLKDKIDSFESEINNKLSELDSKLEEIKEKQELESKDSHSDEAQDTKDSDYDSDDDEPDDDVEGNDEDNDSAYIKQPEEPKETIKSK
ncbi:MAG: hypothetical protein ABIB47_02305 [Candidatus Woesearchaeota archaeon]